MQKGSESPRAEREEAYDAACRSGSISALQSFVSNYPRSPYLDEVKQRIGDYGIWEEAKNTNTMEAYSSYLQKSKSLKYKEEAEKAMLELKAAAEWEKCKQTDSENVLSGFISRYPTSKYADKALYRYNIMVGERYYSSNDESLAEYYLENAAKIKALTGKPAAHLKEIKGAAEFRRIMSSTSLNEVALYLKTLSPGSRYYDRISNRLAVLKADNLDASSSDYSMQDALSYATDEATRSYVKRCNTHGKVKQGILCEGNQTCRAENMVERRLT